MNYFIIKQLHMSAAALSIIFFVVRAYWSITGSGLLARRLVRILPHVIDTVLLVCGVILTFMLGGLQPWIIAKLVALVLYIGIGTIAIKRGKTAGSRGAAALIAIAIFFYIVGVAIRHNPMSWMG
ncbi:SirB2 family protein [Paralcaligenes ureilyticus]|uniref:Putative membrane protein SirB2 n=1 Tax=Paralcaligenes ureilyticus TaxID=627131 RepID=A0A4R3M7T3_9BURK|nr:SirB2 family protein [Paralcaligenes ureilyticus]TCT08653.1 putative membrane protein SirB2 [Paralcaligenes ureilyticus]